MNATGAQPPLVPGWLRQAALAAMAFATIALAVSSAIHGDVGVGSFAGALTLLLGGILLVAGVLVFVVRVVAWRWRPVALAATLLPALTAAASVGLPESAIHFSGQAEWAFRAGREISVAALAAGSMVAAVVAWRHAYRPLAVAGVIALTFCASAVARDLVTRDQQPSWCYADKVEVGPHGEYTTSGTYDGCTIVLPARKP